MLETLQKIAPLVQSFVGLVGTFVGGYALAALKGNQDAKKQQTEIQREKDKTRVEHIAEMCDLSQEIYDIHKQNVYRAVRYLPDNPEKYAETKQHPGRLAHKFITEARIYTENVPDSANRFLEVHNWFKDNYEDLERAIEEESPEILAEKVSSLKNNFESQLKALKAAQLDSSQKISAEARNLSL